MPFPSATPHQALPSVRIGLWNTLVECHRSIDATASFGHLDAGERAAVNAAVTRCLRAPWAAITVVRWPDRVSLVSVVCAQSQGELVNCVSSWCNDALSQPVLRQPFALDVGAFSDDTQQAATALSESLRRQMTLAAHVPPAAAALVCAIDTTKPLPRDVSTWLSTERPFSGFSDAAAGRILETNFDRPWILPAGTLVTGHGRRLWSVSSGPSIETAAAAAIEAHLAIAAGTGVARIDALNFSIAPCSGAFPYLADRLVNHPARLARTLGIGIQ